MSNLNFYERQVEFQNKLNKIHEEQIKLENELKKLNIPAPVSSSERVLELEAYHKKICERERMAKERNYRILREFDEMKRMMATMQLQTARLKQAKIKCMREVERLYPEWKHQLQLNRAQEQLKPNTSTKTQLGMTFPPHGGALTSTPVPKRPVHSSMSNLSMPPPPPPPEQTHSSRPVQINAPALMHSESISSSRRSSSLSEQPKSHVHVLAEPEPDLSSNVVPIDTKTNDDHEDEVFKPITTITAVASSKDPGLFKPSTTAAATSCKDSGLETTTAIGEQTQGITPVLEVDMPTTDGGMGDMDSVKDDDASSDDDDDIPTDSFFNSSNEGDKNEGKTIELSKNDVDVDDHVTEPFTSVHDSVETFNTPIVIPGVKESTLESTLSDTATSVTSQQGNTPLFASSAYQALRDTMDGSSNIPNLDNDDDIDDAENLLSPNVTMTKKKANNETAASSDGDDDDDISSILSSEDESPTKPNRMMSGDQSAYQPSMISSKPNQQPPVTKETTKPKRYRAPWESDSDEDDLGLDDKSSAAAGKKNMDDDDFDFFD